MHDRVTVILAEADAPAKPQVGAACNGCGLCCLSEPCPAGMLVSGRRQGACAALRWEPASRRYRCGLVTAPADVLGWGRGRIARTAGRLLGRVAMRWISAGSGCDATLTATQRDAGAE